MKPIRSLPFVLMLLSGISFLAAKAEPEFTQPGWFSVPLRPTRVAMVMTNAESAKSLPVAEPASFEKSSGAGGTILGVPGGNTPIAEAITPEIQELARGLENDQVKIFEFVRDRIRYVHYFGSKKGATLTLLERSGNDFDQCALLVALLRAAGYTNVKYCFGFVYYPYEAEDGLDLRRWWCLDKPGTNMVAALEFAASFSDAAGFPALDTVPEEGWLGLHHVWVVLKDGEQFHHLDPAFKLHRYVEPAGMLSAWAGLGSNRLWTVAGGELTPDYVSGLSEQQLLGELTACTSSLLAQLASNCPNAEVQELLGGWVLEPPQSQPNWNQFGFVWSDPNYWGLWNYIPTSLMSWFGLVLDSGTELWWPWPALAGRTLTLDFGQPDLLQVYLGEECVHQESVTSGMPLYIQTWVDHPHGVWDWYWDELVDTGKHDAVAARHYNNAGALYVFAYAFDPTIDAVQQAQRELDRLLGTGTAPPHNHRAHQGIAGAGNQPLDPNTRTEPTDFKSATLPIRSAPPNR